MKPKINKLRYLYTFISLVYFGFRAYKFLKKIGVVDALQAKYLEHKQIKLPKIEAVATASFAIKPEERKPETGSQKAKIEKHSESSSLKSGLANPVSGLNSRQQELKSYASSRRNFTMQTIRDSFPDVTARTLRRDLDRLQELGIISQEGKTRNSVYKYLPK
jgi:predicted HTH transcriptional regulator